MSQKYAHVDFQQLLIGLFSWNFDFKKLEKSLKQEFPFKSEKKLDKDYLVKNIST